MLSATAPGPPVSITPSPSRGAQLRRSDARWIGFARPRRHAHVHAHAGAGMEAGQGQQGHASGPMVAAALPEDNGAGPGSGGGGNGDKSVSQIIADVLNESSASRRQSASDLLHMLDSAGGGGGLTTRLTRIWEAGGAGTGGAGSVGLEMQGRWVGGIDARRYAMLAVHQERVVEDSALLKLVFDLVVACRPGLISEGVVAKVNAAAAQNEVDGVLAAIDTPELTLLAVALLPMEQLESLVDGVAAETGRRMTARQSMSPSASRSLLHAQAAMRRFLRLSLMRLRLTPDINVFSVARKEQQGARRTGQPSDMWVSAEQQQASRQQQPPAPSPPMDDEHLYFLYCCERYGTDVPVSCGSTGGGVGRTGACTFGRAAGAPYPGSVRLGREAPGAVGEASFGGALLPEPRALLAALREQQAVGLRPDEASAEVYSVLSQLHRCALLNALAAWAASQREPQGTQAAPQQQRNCTMAVSVRASRDDQATRRLLLHVEGCPELRLLRSQARKYKRDFLLPLAPAPGIHPLGEKQDWEYVAEASALWSRMLGMPPVLDRLALVLLTPASAAKEEGVAAVAVEEAQGAGATAAAAAPEGVAGRNGGPAEQEAGSSLQGGAGAAAASRVQTRRRRHAEDGREGSERVAVVLEQDELRDLLRAVMRLVAASVAAAAGRMVSSSSGGDGSSSSSSSSIGVGSGDGGPWLPAGSPPFQIRRRSNGAVAGVGPQAPYEVRWRVQSPASATDSFATASPATTISAAASVYCPPAPFSQPQLQALVAVLDTASQQLPQLLQVPSTGSLLAQHGGGTMGGTTGGSSGTIGGSVGMAAAAARSNQRSWAEAVRKVVGHAARVLLLAGLVAVPLLGARRTQAPSLAAGPGHAAVASVAPSRSSSSSSSSSNSATARPALQPVNTAVGPEEVASLCERVAEAVRGKTVLPADMKGVRLRYQVVVNRDTGEVLGCMPIGRDSASAYEHLPLASAFRSGKARDAARKHAEAVGKLQATAAKGSAAAGKLAREAAGKQLPLLHVAYKAAAASPPPAGGMVVLHLELNAGGEEQGATTAGPAGKDAAGAAAADAAAAEAEGKGGAWRLPWQSQQQQQRQQQQEQQQRPFVCSRVAVRPWRDSDSVDAWMAQGADLHVPPSVLPTGGTRVAGARGRATRGGRAEVQPQQQQVQVQQQEGGAGFEQALLELLSRAGVEVGPEGAGAAAAAGVAPSSGLGSAAAPVMAVRPAPAGLAVGSKGGKGAVGPTVAGAGAPGLGAGGGAPGQGSAKRDRRASRLLDFQRAVAKGLDGGRK